MHADSAVSRFRGALSTLRAATGDFYIGNLIGEGGFGKVYKVMPVFIITFINILVLLSFVLLLVIKSKV